MFLSLDLFVSHSDPHCFGFIYAEELFDVFEGVVDIATHREHLEGQL